MLYTPARWFPEPNGRGLLWVGDSDLVTQLVYGLWKYKYDVYGKRLAIACSPGQVMIWQSLHFRPRHITPFGAAMCFGSLVAK